MKDVQPVQPLLLGVRQVAALLSLHPDTVRKMIRQGVLPATMLGNSLKVPTAAVLALIPKSGSMS